MSAATTADNRTLAAHVDKIHASMRNVSDVELVTRAGMAMPVCFEDVFTIPTTSLDDVGDIRRLYTFPPGAYLLDFTGTPTDSDSGATPTLVYSILATDSADATQVTLVSSSTNGQAAAGTDSILAAAKGKFCGGYYLSLKVGTAAATAVAMTYKVWLVYSLGVHSYAAGIEPTMTAVSGF